MRTLLGNVTFVPVGVLTVFGKKFALFRIPRSPSWNFKKFISFPKEKDYRLDKQHTRAAVVIVLAIAEFLWSTMTFAFPGKGLAMPDATFGMVWTVIGALGCIVRTVLASFDCWIAGDAWLVGAARICTTCFAAGVTTGLGWFTWAYVKRALTFIVDSGSIKITNLRVLWNWRSSNNVRSWSVGLNQRSSHTYLGRICRYRRRRSWHLLHLWSNCVIYWAPWHGLWWCLLNRSDRLGNGPYAAWRSCSDFR